MHSVLALVRFSLLALLAPALAAQVSNDTCATATPIGEGLVRGNNSQALNNLPMTICGFESPFIRDVWYRVDAQEKGVLRATFGCGGASFDPGLFLFGNDCGAPLYQGCNDDSCELMSQIDMMVTPSEPLWIAVAGLQTTVPAGQFTLKVTVDPVSQFIVAAPRVMHGWNGFSGPLSSGDNFGEVAAPGDIDADGVADVAVGAPGDDDGSSNAGAVWLLSLTVDGTVLAQHKLSATVGGLAGLGSGDAFGTSVAGLGDLDGDGLPDLAVGAPLDDDGSPETGSVWILLLAPDASVKSASKLSTASGGFGGALDSGDWFGTGLAALGDVDGDGVVDLAVGAEQDDDGGIDVGAVWILFLQADGTVRSWQKLSATSGGFAGTLPSGARFGGGLGAAGDIDGDGVPDLAIGAPTDGPGRVWTVLLNRDGTAKAANPIEIPTGFPPDPAAGGAQYGAALCTMGDLDGNGVPDLAVGAPGVDHGTDAGIGAVFQVFLDTDGTSSQQSLLTPLLSFPYDTFADERIGRALSCPGDLDADGHADLLIGDFPTLSGFGGFTSVFLDPTNAWAILPDGALVGGNTFAPELRGEGSLQPGTAWNLELSIAARNSPATFVVGLDALFAPFKGGVLVPAPNLVIGGFLTDGDGRIELQGLWPGGVPAQVQLWIQAFVVDDGAVAGLAASNGVMATTP